MTARRRFELYPEEQHWWTFSDYEAVLDVMSETGARRVLEFGPGSSTLALVEGGAEHIDTCEDDEHWAGIYLDRLVPRFPDVIHLRRYEYGDPLRSVPGIDASRYDLALIDGPRETTRRPSILRYCLDRCAYVLMPTEEDADGESWLRPRIEFWARESRRPVEFFKTGPTAGSFALLRPSC